MNKLQKFTLLASISGLLLAAPSLEQASSFGLNSAQAQTITGSGADTGPSQIDQGIGGMIQTDPVTAEQAKQQAASQQIITDSDDADPVGPGIRWSILAVLALVLMGIGIYYVSMMRPVKN